MQRHPEQVAAWHARAKAHNGPTVPVRLRYNTSLPPDSVGWFLVDVAPKCSTTNLAFLGRDLASEEVGASSPCRTSPSA